MKRIIPFLAIAICFLFVSGTVDAGGFCFGQQQFVQPLFVQQHFVPVQQQFVVQRQFIPQQQIIVNQNRGFFGGRRNQVIVNQNGFNGGFQQIRIR